MLARLTAWTLERCEADWSIAHRERTRTIRLNHFSANRLRAWHGPRLSNKSHVEHCHPELGRTQRGSVGTCYWGSSAAVSSPARKGAKLRHRNSARNHERPSTSPNRDPGKGWTGSHVESSARPGFSAANYYRLDPPPHPPRGYGWHHKTRFSSTGPAEDVV